MPVPDNKILSCEDMEQPIHIQKKTQMPMNTVNVTDCETIKNSRSDRIFINLHATHDCFCFGRSSDRAGSDHDRSSKRCVAFTKVKSRIRVALSALTIDQVLTASVLH